MSSAVVRSRIGFRHKWIPCQSHKYHGPLKGSSIEAKYGNSRTLACYSVSRALGTFCRQMYLSPSPYHQQRVCVFSVSVFYPHSIVASCRQFSASPWRLTDATTNEYVTIPRTAPTVSPGLESTSSVTASDVIETSAHAQWASDAALVTSGDNLSSLGLGGYSPIGLIQSSMEWIHIHTGMPWWASIITCTVILRTALLPIAIKMQANTARMNNIRPETEKLMAKIKHHNRFGQHNLTAIANKKLMDLYREHNCSPVKLALTPFIQIPIFISFFIGLRRMAAAPIESMKTGGALWFTDLTQLDPYYVLPFCSCGLLLATIEVRGYHQSHAQCGH